MTREERDNALKVLKNYDLNFHKINGMLFSAEEIANAFDLAIKALEQEPCEDVISRKSIKQKLQEKHDFFVNAYGGFSNLPQNDKSRVDEITNCIAMVVNEPPVIPQEPFINKSCVSSGVCERDKNKMLDKIRAEIEQAVSRYSISRERGGMGQVEWSDSLIKESEVLKILDKCKAESEEVK